MLVDELGNIPLLYYSYKNLVSDKIQASRRTSWTVHPTRFISKD